MGWNTCYGDGGAGPLTEADLTDKEREESAMHEIGYGSIEKHKEEVLRLEREIEDRETELEQQRIALVLAADTLKDLKTATRLLGRPLLSSACEIAELATREALK